MEIIRKSILVLLALVVILTGCSLKACAEPTEERTQALMYMYGQIFKEYLDSGIYNENELARYTSKLYTLAGNERSDDEILDTLRRRSAMLHEAKKLGLYIMEHEFNEEFNYLQILIRQEDEVHSAILAFCAGAEISEDEFWRLASPYIRDEWTIGNLTNHLYEHFMTDNSGNDRRNNLELFDIYYRDYVDELKLKYDKEKDGSSSELTVSQLLRLLFIGLTPRPSQMPQF